MMRPIRPSHCAVVACLMPGYVKRPATGVRSTRLWGRAVHMRLYRVGSVASRVPATLRQEGVGPAYIRACKASSEEKCARQTEACERPERRTMMRERRLWLKLLSIYAACRKLSLHTMIGGPAAKQYIADTSAFVLRMSDRPSRCRGLRDWSMKRSQCL